MNAPPPPSPARAERTRLTRVSIRNFKRLEAAEVELDSAVVFVGPNNSGKSSALQALALWQLGVRRWSERRSGKRAPAKRPGVAINRRDLLAAPVPSAKLLWRDLHVREVSRAKGKQRTRNVVIEITVTGVTGAREWTAGLEFDYANEESFYCRPLRRADGSVSAVPEEAARVELAFLRRCRVSPPTRSASNQEP